MVFPNADYDPSGGTKTSVGIPVALDIGFDLGPPPGGIRFGPSAMFGTSVPKAAVDQDGDTRTGKSDVDKAAPTLDNLTVQSKAEAPPVEFGA